MQHVRFFKRLLQGKEWDSAPDLGEDRSVHESLVQISSAEYMEASWKPRPHGFVTQSLSQDLRRRLLDKDATNRYLANGMEGDE